MSIDQPGLRIRLEKEMRRMASQHQQLATLFLELHTALDGPTNAPHATAAFARYQQALLAHFSMEDRVAFPALHGLRPELTVRLEGLAEEHHSLRSDVESLGRAIGSSPNPPGAPGVSALVKLTSLGDALRQHEAREEELVAMVRASD